MISQRKVITEYNKMRNLEEIQGEVDENKINLYTCDNTNCDGKVKTIDIDNGTTPMKVTCLKCGSTMQSSFYKDIPDEPEITMEWYRPELKDVLKRRKNAGLLEHILKGGLMLRAITKPKEKNPLEIAVDVLQNLKFKAMPSSEKFYKIYTEKLRESLNLKE